MFNSKPSDKESSKTTPSPRARKVCVNLVLGQTAAVDAVIETTYLGLRQKG